MDYLKTDLPVGDCRSYTELVFCPPHWKDLLESMILAHRSGQSLENTFKEELAIDRALRHIHFALVMPAKS